MKYALLWSGLVTICLFPLLLCTCLLSYFVWSFFNFLILLLLFKF